MIATDCEALAYQAAALSDTARVVTFLRPVFLVWRLIVLLLLTRNTPCSAPARLDLAVQGSAQAPISHRQTALVKGLGAEQVNTI